MIHFLLNNSVFRTSQNVRNTELLRCDKLRNGSIPWLAARLVYQSVAETAHAFPRVVTVAL